MKLWFPVGSGVAAETSRGPTSTRVSAAATRHTRASGARRHSNPAAISPPASRLRSPPRLRPSLCRPLRRRRQGGVLGGEAAASVDAAVHPGTGREQQLRGARASHERLLRTRPDGEAGSVSVIAFITATKMPPHHQHEEEKFFLNAKGQKETLPSIWDSPTKQLSVVVPSYNEEKRLPVMMDEALNYLEKRQKQDPMFTYEVIVVDDGSQDQTSQGVFSSRGEKILMADADGATKFPDVEKLEKGLSDLRPWPDQMAIACGSRAHLEKESIAQVYSGMLNLRNTGGLLRKSGAPRRPGSVMLPGIYRCISPTCLNADDSNLIIKL